MFTESLAGSNTTVVKDRPGTEQAWMAMQPNELAVAAGMTPESLMRQITDLSAMLNKQNQVLMAQSQNQRNQSSEYAPGLMERQGEERAGQERVSTAVQNLYSTGMTDKWAGLWGRLNKLMQAPPETSVKTNEPNAGLLAGAQVMGTVGSALMGPKLV